MSSSTSGDFASVAFAGFFLGIVVLLLYFVGLAAFFIGIPLLIIFLTYFAVKKYLNSERRQERLAQQEFAQIYARALEARKDHPDYMSWGRLLFSRWPEGIPEELNDELFDMAIDEYRLRDFEFTPPPPVANSIEGGRWKDVMAKVPHPGAAMEPWLALAKTVKKHLPPMEKDGLPFDVLLRDTIEPPFVEEVVNIFLKQKAYELISMNIENNIHKVSGIPFDPMNRYSPNLVMPTECKLEFPASAYFKDTPLEKLLDKPVGYTIPLSKRYMHTMVAGRSGAGKSSMLEKMLEHDLQSDRSIVLIDSQQALIPKILKLKALEGRNVILLDPKEKPALNIFALNHKRLSTYDETQRDQVYNHTIEIFHYLLNSMIGADLYTRQENLFGHVIAAMLAMPHTMGRNATVEDIMHIMVDTKPYQEAIDSLQQLNRDFFKIDFPNYKQTKEQVRYRIQALLLMNALKPYLTSTENKVDFFTELNNPEGTIILIDTNKAYMADTPSANLGRIALTLILNAILERAGHESYKHPTMIYCDEAGEYMNEGTKRTPLDRFLIEARKQNCGFTFAFQQFNLLNPSFKASAITNTGVKCIGGISSADASLLYRDMRTTVDAIIQVPEMHFNVFVQGTKKPVEAVVQFDILGSMDQRKKEEVEAFRKENRERVCVPPALPAPEPQAEAPPTNDPPPTADADNIDLSPA